MRLVIVMGFSLAVAFGSPGCSEPSDEGAGAEPEAAAPATAEPTELDVEDVAARLAGGEDIFLLDVRTSEELVQDGAIEGYTHIPIDELESRLAEVPKDKPIVAY